MDEKTAELRDIFIETTGSETVTERQTESRGSLADVDDPEEVRARVLDLVTTMRDRYEFETDCADDDLVNLVVGYFDGESDEELALELDVPPETVRTARLDLHLVRDADREAPFDMDRLDKLLVEGADDDAIAERLDEPLEIVAQFRPVAEADIRSSRVNYRFRDDFAELLTDDDLSQRMAEDARNDGLREATEDIETDVSL
ncbi:MULTISPECIES: conditioned medium-induced protein 4 [Haloferax]|uniref:Conditioned medium-induced protein 4 n=1 Tax=Haloferax marinum TaxID=2666143 RepID=A0A6A8G7K3_9EURY|nr:MULTISPECIES: conditioned medium-induced protein 4 [Haloferax]KAB1197513.1 conditioned medium-induced protein 4 [Haloferax sp. CBA1150]MRW96558.1 conditioned medium-induced protein 4 [Haloferax marinum]